MSFIQYFNLWACFIPISSIVLSSSIKGTLPSYLFAVISGLLVVGFSKKCRHIYIKNLAMIIFYFIFCTLMAQLGLLIYGAKFADICLVDPLDQTIFFKNTLITQTLYLLMGILTFLFIKLMYNQNFDRYIFYGGVALAVYGLYEVLYFSMFFQSGDFLSNRTFGDVSDPILGSAFQTIQLGGFDFQRLKSLTAEPSTFAFTILPYWVYAIHKKKIFYQYLFLFTLILSTSTSAIMGIIAYIGIRWFYLGFKDGYVIKFLFSVVCISLIGWDFVSDLWTSMVVDKVMLNNLSGLQRNDLWSIHLNYFFEMPLLNQIFGIGFGYIRSTDLFTTLLVNTGIVGILGFTGCYLYPLAKLENDYESIGLKAILIIIYIVSMAAVPEFGYLTMWLFLGIAYQRIRKDESGSRAG